MIRKIINKIRDNYTPNGGQGDLGTIPNKPLNVIDYTIDNIENMYNIKFIDNPKKEKNGKNKNL